MVWKAFLNNNDINFNREFKEPIIVKIIQVEDGTKYLYNSLNNCYFINEDICRDTYGFGLDKYIKELKLNESISKRKYKGYLAGKSKKNIFDMVRVS